MARRVLALMPEFTHYQLTGVVSRTPAEGLPDAIWLDSLADVKTPPDILIDFSLPGGTRNATRWCARNGVALLSGTTGLSEEDHALLRDAAQTIPVLWAPNLSRGVALLTVLVRQAAAVVGVQTNVTIADVHHRHKIDSPSGTALALARAVVQGRSEPLADLLEPARLADLSNGDVGELAFTSVREGEVIGDHTVRFESNDEVIELRHRALDRDVFASGALKAGAWLVRQKPGIYTTIDWLGLNRESGGVS